MKTCILALALFAVTLAADIKECSPNGNNCDADECCVEEMQFSRVGRRGLLIDPPMQRFPWGNREGRCIKYWQEGENCFSQQRWATCGCAAGLKCLFTPAADDDNNGPARRAIPPWLLPKGTHACVQDNA